MARLEGTAELVTGHGEWENIQVRGRNVGDNGRLTSLMFLTGVKTGVVSDV